MRARSDNKGAAFWVCYAIASASALISAFYSLSALFGEGAGDTYALYAASRSIALVLAVLSVAILRSRTVLVVLALIMAVVQGLDALIGFADQDVMKTIGPAVLAIITIIAVVALIRSRGVNAHKS